MENLTSRDIQALKTKENITKAAISLVKDKGLDNVKITDICQMANVSVGTFYNHFKSKESIIENAYESVDTSIEETVDKRAYSNYYQKILVIFEEANNNISSLGYKFMADTFKYILSKPKNYSIENSRYPYKTIKQAVKAGIADGEFKSDIDPIEVTHDFMRIGRGTVFDWCLHQGKFDLVFETEKIVKAYLDSIVSI